MPKVAQERHLHNARFGIRFRVNHRRSPGLYDHRHDGRARLVRVRCTASFALRALLRVAPAVVVVNLDIDIRILHLVGAGCFAALLIPDSEPSSTCDSASGMFFRNARGGPPDLDQRTVPTAASCNLQHLATSAVHTREVGTYPRSLYFSFAWVAVGSLSRTWLCEAQMAQMPLTCSLSVFLKACSISIEAS